jgi:hypothetical protein
MPWGCLHLGCAGDTFSGLLGYLFVCLLHLLSFIRKDTFGYHSSAGSVLFSLWGLLHLRLDLRYDTQALALSICYLLCLLCDILLAHSLRSVSSSLSFLACLCLRLLLSIAPSVPSVSSSVASTLA